MNQSTSFKSLVVISFLILLLLFINCNFDLWTVRRNFSQIKYRDEIDKYSARFKIEPELIAALIYVESRFDKDSKSPKGALGLMQLMPATAYWVAEQLNYDNFKLEDLNNPEMNIEFGSWYFSYLYNKFDQDLIKSTAAYNAGENNVRKWIDSGWDGDIKDQLPFGETDDFVRRVISTKKYYRNYIFQNLILSDFKLFSQNRF